MPLLKKNQVFANGKLKALGLAGKGACGEVHRVRLTDGSCDGRTWVVKVSELPAHWKNSKKVKKGKPRELLTAANALFNEYTVYESRLKPLHGTALPRKGIYGNDEDAKPPVRYLVLEALAEDVGQEVAGGKLEDPKRCAETAQGMLRCVQSMHQTRGGEILFVDVKPENFMRRASTGAIVAVDMGVAESWKKGGRHRSEEDKGPGGNNGNSLFAGLHAHRGALASRRDDAEAVGLCAVWMLRGGNLPWSAAASDAAVLEAKEALSPQALTAGLPGAAELAKYLSQCRGLAYAEEPDYDALWALLAKVAKAKAKAKAKTKTKAKAAGKTKAKPAEAPPPKRRRGRAGAPIEVDSDDSDDDILGRAEDREESPRKARFRARAARSTLAVEAMDTSSDSEFYSGGASASAAAAAAPPSGPYATLTVTAGPHKGDTFRVGEDGGSVGADAKAAVALPRDGECAKRHAKVAVVCSKVGVLSLKVTAGASSTLTVAGNVLKPKKAAAGFNGQIVEVGATALRIKLHKA